MNDQKPSLKECISRLEELGYRLEIVNIQAESLEELTERMRKLFAEYKGR